MRQLRQEREGQSPNTTSMTPNQLRILKLSEHIHNWRVWLTPLDIGWVVSGNHSIAQAIIAGEGHIVPREAYDITNLLSDIYFDGKYWKHSSGDSLGHMPRYEELGWAWEISRMISMLD